MGFSSRFADEIAYLHRYWTRRQQAEALAAVPDA